MAEWSSSIPSLIARATSGLHAALDDVGLTGHAIRGDPRVTLHVDVDVESATHSFPVQVTSDVGPAKAMVITARNTPPLLVVAARIAGESRRVLSDAGISWLDLRGHLHLRGTGLRIDTPVTLPDTTVPRTSDGPPIRGHSGIAVAYWLSAHRDEVFSPTLASLVLGMAPAPSALRCAISTSEGSHRSG